MVSKCQYKNRNNLKLLYHTISLPKPKDYWFPDTLRYKLNSTLECKAKLEAKTKQGHPNKLAAILFLFQYKHETLFQEEKSNWFPWHLSIYFFPVVELHCFDFVILYANFLNLLLLVIWCFQNKNCVCVSGSDFQPNICSTTTYNKAAPANKTSRFPFCTLGEKTNKSK